MLGLPDQATAPFCPSEVRGTIEVPRGVPFWRRLLAFAGPGLIVAVGYMDPGNWATDIEAGSRYGYALLWVVVAASLAAMLLQTLSMRLGIATGRDLAQMCHQEFRPGTNIALWLLAELAIIACDLAEVLGCALAFHLLFDVSIFAGVLLTVLDTLLVIGFKGQGFRKLEAVVLALVATVSICFFFELLFATPHWPDLLRGLWPGGTPHERQALYLAIGILGATVMPHNLYLHSSIVQTRMVASDEGSRSTAIRMLRLDTIVSLTLAMLVNCAILTLAASAFHGAGHTEVAGIEEAHTLLAPLFGTGVAAVLFGVALLAAGQSSTFTGTIAGQIIMEGFLNLKMPCWRRHVITRALALVPAAIGVAWLGEGSVGTLLVFSQVVLSLQLPFALVPLVRLTDQRRLMGAFANSRAVSLLAWLLVIVITLANAWLVLQWLGS
ncbi:MAG: Nramp family divalent metal transporter [Steroidobacteraceae bacterium]